MDRSRVGRGVAILAVSALAVAVVSPAFGDFNPTKAKIKKIAKKQAKQQINALGPGLFIQETELDRFGPVPATTGEAEKTIATFGPFSLSILCTDNGGFDRVQVQIATTAANSTVNSDDSDEDVFDPTDVDVDVDDNTASTATQESYDDDAEFWAGGPGGTPAYHGWVATATNYGGGDCYARGWVLAL